MTSPSEFDRRQRVKARRVRWAAVAGVALFVALLVGSLVGRDDVHGTSYWDAGGKQFLLGLAAMAALGYGLYRWQHRGGR